MKHTIGNIEDKTVLSGDTQVLPDPDIESLVLARVVEKHEKRPDERASGVIVGTLVGFSDSGCPRVAFIDNNRETGPIDARSTMSLSGTEIGREVILMFERDDYESPIVMGVLQEPGGVSPSIGAAYTFRADRSEAKVAHDRLVITAERELVLTCGGASITLTRAGKILLRGAYLLSRSSGVNLIKGGSVQIN